MSKAKLRSIAADILVRVECEHAYATIALAQLENERTLEPQDIRVIQKLVRGVLETRASLDSILAELLS